MYVFSPCMILQNLETLIQYSYFYGNIIVYINSIRICPPILPGDKVIGNTDYVAKLFPVMPHLRMMLLSSYMTKHF